MLDPYNRIHELNTLIYMLSISTDEELAVVLIYFLLLSLYTSQKPYHALFWCYTSLSARFETIIRSPPSKQLEYRSIPNMFAGIDNTGSYFNC